MKIGDRIRAEFTDTSILGAGVARVDGMAVFCHGAVAGDIAEIEITAVNKRYAEAALLRIFTPSADRISPDCTVFKNCGGCTFRHISYDAEAKLKEKSVRGALRRFDSIRWDPIFTGMTDHYRNKTVFHLDFSFRAGYYAAATNRFCYPNDGGCLLLPPLFGEIARATTSSLQKSAQGLPFRALGIRQSAEGNFTAVLYAESDSGEVRRGAEIWAEEIRRAFPQASGLFFGIGMPEDRDVRYELLFGEAYLCDSFLNLELQISPAAFYQVNHFVAEELCRTVARYADLQPGEIAADLYCGTGTIGLSLAALSPQATVMGIEIVESAVRDAVANAERNHMKNIRFRCGDSATAEAEGMHFDCIVIDPPRKGCSPAMIEALTRLDPKRIVYVSCNPATLARDAALLAEAGWVVTRAQPFDMFPRTGHCETVCMLTKDN